MTNVILRHKYPLLLGFGIFLFIYIFFAQVHPVYPFDADDWTYLYNTREMYPITSAYNPTRVLPEILMPFCGEVAMTMIYPFVQDITLSVSYAASLFLALFITGYMLAFYRVMRKVFELPASSSTMLVLLFLSFHFLFFRIEETENQHMFYSFDLCCYFNYTIPNIIASTLILLFISERFESLSLSHHTILLGGLFLALYLCVLSHLFASIILVTYLSLLLFFRGIQHLHRHSNIAQICRKYLLHIIVVVGWLIGLLFEVNGRRAETVESIAQTEFLPAIRQSVRALYIIMAQQTNGLMWSLLGLAAISTIVISLRKRVWNHHLTLITIALCAAVISSLLVIILGAKTYPYYLLRTNSVYAVPYFILLSGFFCMATLLSRFSYLTASLPFLLLLVYCEIEQKGKTFQDIQTLKIPQDIQGTYQVHPNEIHLINQRNINAIIENSKIGATEMQLQVPAYDHVDNWPLAFYYGKRLSRFLYKYGEIDYPIKVEIIYQTKNNDQKD